MIIHWSQGIAQSLWEGVALKVPMQKVPKRDSLRVLREIQTPTVDSGKKGKESNGG